MAELPNEGSGYHGAAVKAVECLPFLWLAFALYDAGNHGPVRWGWTKEQAVRRAALA